MSVTDTNLIMDAVRDVTVLYEVNLLVLPVERILQ